MLKNILIYFFSIAEISLGFIQCAVVFKNLTPNGLDSENIVLLAAGFLSSILGLGLLLKKSLAAKALLFFASGVAFSKFLILGGVFTLPSSAQILFPKTIENTVSIVYHIVLVLFLFRTSKHHLD